MTRQFIGWAVEYKCDRMVKGLTVYLHRPPSTSKPTFVSDLADATLFEETVANVLAKEFAAVPTQQAPTVVAVYAETHRVIDMPPNDDLTPKSQVETIKHIVKNMGRPK